MFGFSIQVSPNIVTCQMRAMMISIDLTIFGKASNADARDDSIDEIGLMIRSLTISATMELL